MCLGIPCEVIRVDEEFAIVSLSGAEVRAAIHLVPDVKKGDYVLVHAGFILEKIDEDEALKTLELLEQMQVINEVH